MTEQKIISLVWSETETYDAIKEELKKGWIIKYPPTVIPPFADYAPEVIFILERKEIKI